MCVTFCPAAPVLPGRAPLAALCPQHRTCRVPASLHGLSLHQEWPPPTSSPSKSSPGSYELSRRAVLLLGDSPRGLTSSAPVPYLGGISPQWTGPAVPAGLSRSCPPKASSLAQGQRAFPVKGQVASIFRFVGQIVSGVTAQFCHGGAEAATGCTSPNGHDRVPIRLK